MRRDKRLGGPRNGKGDGAAHAVGSELVTCLGPELIRQRALDELAAIASSRRVAALPVGTRTAGLAPFHAEEPLAAASPDPEP
jgi:hypothetical protein